MITTRRVWRVVKSVCPCWMGPVLGVCVLIPGPQDEVAVLLVAALFVLANWPQAVSAWRSGSKSHRQRDHGIWVTGVMVPVW